MNNNSRTSNKYKQWKKKVLERDHYTCQHCGTFSKSKKIQAHHIFKFYKYEQYRHDIRNGVSLCKDCHKLYDENECIHWQNKYRKLKDKYNKLIKQINE